MNLSIVSLNVLGIVGHIREDIKVALHYYDWLIIVALIGFILLLVGSIDRRIEEVGENECSAGFYYGWYLCFVTMGISALLHPTRDVYKLWFILSLTIIPMILMVWHKRGDLQKLYTLVAHNMVLASYCFLIINIISVAFITNNYYFEGLKHEYLGIAPNPNSNGMIVLPFFTSALYLIVTNHKNKAFNTFSLFFCAMIAFISNTRTAELAMVLEIIVTLLLVLRHKEHYKWKVPIKKTIEIIAIALVSTIVTGYCLMYIDKVDLKSYAVGEMEQAAAEVNSDEDLIKINALSGGRLILWKAYMGKVSFVGHGNPTEPVFEGYEMSRWAHNNAIDIWYASGFIAFAGYIIWLLAAWGFIIKWLIKNEGFRKEYLLTALAFMGYFVEAMLEITIYPMQTGIALLCFLTLTPIAFKEQARTTRYKQPEEIVYPNGGPQYE